MRRNENQPPRPTAGPLPVLLFNQKKRNRVPLTSTPSENELFSHTEYAASTSSALTQSMSGTYGSYQASASSSGALHSPQLSKQAVPESTYQQKDGSHRPTSHIRSYTLIPHPYKPAGTSSKMGQTNAQVRQDFSSVVDSRPNKYQPSCSDERAQSKQTPQTGLSQMSRQASFTHQRWQQPAPPAVPPPSRSARAEQPQSSWNFTNSFGPQRSAFQGKKTTNKPPIVQQSQTQDKTVVKPASETSLRILTAVIDGMRHWSQFRDKVPYLFEIFGTLDSAVTLGRHGAKNFLMRDGRGVVQCIFYENEKELPRLIRGQVHRCVGNYDRSGDVLMCVSVRPSQPSELRNAQQAVRACDAEMRRLVKSLSEV